MGVGGGTGSKRLGCLARLVNFTQLRKRTRSVLRLLNSCPIPNQGRGNWGGVRVVGVGEEGVRRTSVRRKGTCGVVIYPTLSDLVQMGG